MFRVLQFPVGRKDGVKYFSAYAVELLFISFKVDMSGSFEEAEKFLLDLTVVLFVGFETICVSFVVDYCKVADMSAFHAQPADDTDRCSNYFQQISLAIVMIAWKIDFAGVGRQHYFLDDCLTLLGEAGSVESNFCEVAGDDCRVKKLHDVVLEKEV